MPTPMSSQGNPEPTKSKATPEPTKPSGAHGANPATVPQTVHKGGKVG